MKPGNNIPSGGASPAASGCGLAQNFDNPTKDPLGSGVPDISAGLNGNIIDPNAKSISQGALGGSGYTALANDLVPVNLQTINSANTSVANNATPVWGKSEEGAGR